MKKIFFILFTLVPAMSLAAVGTDQGNGGDACENRIQEIREDIGNWILKGGSQGLKLPKGVSLNKFNQGMLEQFDRAKISCTDKSLFVAKAEKTCLNTKGGDGTPFIQCNVQRFENTSESDQYMLIHHEYAGLAGFEVNSGETSNYEISNQVTGYLENQVVKKLVVRKTASYVVSGRAKAFLGPQGEIITTIPLNNNTKLLVYAQNTYGFNDGKVLVYEFHGDIGSPQAGFRTNSIYKGSITLTLMSDPSSVVTYIDYLSTKPEVKTYAIKVQYSSELSKNIEVQKLLGRAQEFKYP